MVDLDKIMSSIFPTGGNIEYFIISKFFKTDKLVKEFKQKTNDFFNSQKKVLNEIIRKNEATKWGRNHNFSRLTPENWDSAPIITYEQVHPYIQRIKQGDIYSLTSSVPIAFGITSGTTSEPKLIILTNESIKNQKKASDIWNIHLYKDYTPFLNNILVLSGGAKSKNTEILPINSYTNIVKSNQPPYVNKRFILPKCIENISDLEHRLLISIQQSFIRPPETLISVNPITILKFLDLAENHKKEIKRATENNKYVGTNLKIKPIKNKNQVLKNISSKNPLNSVEIISTWLGGTQYLFINELRKRGIKNKIRDLGYLATEGRFTIPLEDNCPSGILNPFGNFYEFMTLDKKNLIPSQELKKGEEYNIIITSENGLYRYDIQDVIKVDGWYNQTPIISFRRKDIGFSSLIGEKIHENHVVELLEQLRCSKGFLSAIEKPLHYKLTIPKSSIKEKIDSKNLSPEDIDYLLQEINPEYFQKRESNRLECLEVNILEDNEFNELNEKINPHIWHDRYKQRFLIPLI